MFAPLIEKLQRRQDLTIEEAATAMDAIMDGRAQPAHIAGLLIALAMKGERPAEIVGFAQTMRARATKVQTKHGAVFDTCGTGGDRAHTFNVSTLAALVLAACGVRVAKHGNRSVSSRCGSADLFEALGVNIVAEPAVVERCLDEAGIAFFFAPTFHPSMRHAASTRKELGVRTAFNLLGPLTNPAGAARQLVGVPRPELTELVARSLALLGSERAWVVHGADGLDEISTTGYTKVSEVRDGAVNTFYVHPSDFGLPKSVPTALAGGDAAENAAIARRVLAGERGAARDIVVLNAAASLLIAGQAATVRDGIALASHALDDGGAAAVLQRLVNVSQSAKEATASSITSAPDLLATIVAATRRIVEGREADRPASVLAREQTREPRGRAFVDALHTSPEPRIIAECKRRSPSRGILRADYAPAEHAVAYAEAGAAAISVLTEPTFFDGAPEHLAAVRAVVDLPLLRKDFIISEYQLLEAAVLGADAVLLIVGALQPAELRSLQQAASAMGLASLVEVHDLPQLQTALDAGAEVVGVNSRNLRTLEVNISVLDRVAETLPGEVIAVAESGIKQAADIRRLSAAGYHAFLVGERLIAQPDPGAALRELRQP